MKYNKATLISPILLIFVIAASLISYDLYFLIQSSIDGHKYAFFTILLDRSARIDESLMYFSNAAKGNMASINNNGYISGANSIQDITVLPNLFLKIAVRLAVNNKFSIVMFRFIFIFVSLSLLVAIIRRGGTSVLVSVALAAFACYELTLAPIAYLNAFHLMKAPAVYNPELILLGNGLEKHGISLAQFAPLDFSWFPEANSRPVLSRINSPLLCLPFFLLFCLRLQICISDILNKNCTVRSQTISVMLLSFCIWAIAFSYPPYLLVALPWIILSLALTHKKGQSVELYLALGSAIAAIAIVKLHVSSFSAFHRAAIGSGDQGPWEWRGWFTLFTLWLSHRIYVQSRRGRLEPAQSVFLLGLAASSLGLMILSAPLARLHFLTQIWTFPHRIWIYTVPILLGGVIAGSKITYTRKREIALVAAIVLAVTVVTLAELHIARISKQGADISEDYAFRKDVLSKPGAIVAFTEQKHLAYIAATSNVFPLTTYAISADINPAEITERMLINYQLTGRPLPQSLKEVIPWLTSLAFADAHSLNVFHWIYHHGAGGRGLKAFPESEVLRVAHEVNARSMCTNLEKMRVTYVYGHLNDEVKKQLDGCSRSISEKVRLILPSSNPPL